jgi:hypothetical protein
LTVQKPSRDIPELPTEQQGLDKDRLFDITKFDLQLEGICSCFDSHYLLHITLF